jgi:hypothetical protein
VSRFSSLPSGRQKRFADFHIFQYFISVVSTSYIDTSKRVLDTNQYSVTDMARETQHGRGVPGIFFKYDIEPMKLTIQERTTVCSGLSPASCLNSPRVLSNLSFGSPG